MHFGLRREETAGERSGFWSLLRRTEGRALRQATPRGGDGGDIDAERGEFSEHALEAESVTEPEDDLSGED